MQTFSSPPRLPPTPNEFPDPVTFFTIYHNHRIYDLTRRAFHTSNEFAPSPCLLSGRTLRFDTPSLPYIPPPPPSPCQCLSSPFPLSKNRCVNENQTLSQILKGACLPHVILSSKAEKRQKQILEGLYVQLPRCFSIEFRKRVIFRRCF